MQAGTEEANPQSAGTEAGSETLFKEALAGYSDFSACQHCYRYFVCIERKAMPVEFSYGYCFFCSIWSAPEIHQYAVRMYPDSLSRMLHRTD